MQPGETLSADQTRQWRRTLRLTFSYDGEKIELIERRSVEMIPPAPNTPLPTIGHAGFWYVVRDAQGEVFYYRVIRNPLPLSQEVIPLPGELSFTNIDRERARATFEILVPDTPESDSLSFLSTHPLVPGEGGLGDGSRQQPAREIAHFSLRAEQPK